MIKWSRQHCPQVGTWADPYALLLRLCILGVSDHVLFRDGHSDRCDVGILSLFLTLEASDGVSSLTRALICFEDVMSTSVSQLVAYVRLVVY